MTARLGASAPRIPAVTTWAGELADREPLPAVIEGQSRTAGVLKGPGGSPEAGIWVCTPGVWECHATRDEFRHFVGGRGTYTHESGEVIEMAPDTAAFFPAAHSLGEFGRGHLPAPATWSPSRVR